MTKREQFDRAMNILGTRRQRSSIELHKKKSVASAKIPEITLLEQKMSQSTIKLSKFVLSKNSNTSEIISRIMQENLDAQRRIEDLLVSRGFASDYLKEQHICIRCGDTGFVDGVRCSCLAALIQKIAIEDFNKSTSMSLCMFQDFRVNYYSNQSKNANGQSDFEIMSQIYNYCKTYADTFTMDSPSILMMGNTGLGKTHLSLSIANEVLQKGFSVLYGTAQEYFTQIQNEYFGRSRNGEDTLQTILDADLFILDDLGAEYESSFNGSTFYNMVNARLNHGRPTIINTNMLPKEIETRYTKRVASRLMTLYSCLKFVGTDIRQIKLRE